MTGYHEVVSWVEEALRKNHLRPGDMLPSERIMARVCGVSRPTISRAMIELRHRGVIESRQGKGHFIRRIPEEDIAPNGRFL